MTNVGDRPVRDVMVRLEHARGGDVVGGPAHQPGRRRRRSTRRSPTSSRWRPELEQGQNVPFTLSYPVRSTELPSLQHRPARRLPRAGQRQRHPRLRRARAPRRRPLPAAGARRATRPVHRRGRPAVGRRATRHVAADPHHHAVAAGRPATPRRGRPGRHHPGPPRRRRSGDLAGRRWPARHAALGDRLRDQPGRRPRRPGPQRHLPRGRPRPAGHRERDDGGLRRQRRSPTAG